MKDKIGKFQGVPVYATTTKDFVSNKYYNDMDNIYLVGDSLIRHNEVFANYDGKAVHEIDLHNRYTFYQMKAMPNMITDISPSYPDPNKAPVENATVEEILAGVYKWQVG